MNSHVKCDVVTILLRLAVRIAALLTFGTLLFLVGFILIRGVPNLTPELFAPVYHSTNVSMFPAIITTLMMTILALAVATPLGIFTAIYLVEYARRGSCFVRIIRLTAETLSGIPSIVYGLFGLLFFVTYLGWNYSLLSGAATVAIMVLPLVMRTAEEALLSVPDSYREASFGLGAGRLRTVVRIALPAAAPGILAGVILAVGRIVGETAALIYTLGTVPKIPDSLMASGRTLALHMYALSSEGLYTDAAYATAVVLLLIVALINAASAALARRLGKG
ncbi:MAG: phosphate ABC transporter permease PstA, partial [Oscillospiraceae bacterium]